VWEAFSLTGFLRKNVDIELVEVLTGATAGKPIAFARDLA